MFIFNIFVTFSTQQNRISNASANIYRRRSISSGISRSLDAATIKKRIENCEIVTLLRDESLEAGYILNILYSLDKLPEMKGQHSNCESQDMEILFMRNFWEEINKFQIREALEIESEENVPAASMKPSDEVDGGQEDDCSVLCSDTNGQMDTLLSMVFDQYASSTKSYPISKPPDDVSMDCYRLYKKFVLFLLINIIIIYLLVILC